MKIEIPAETEIFINNIKVKAIESNHEETACSYCFFNRLKPFENCRGFECLGRNRKDKKNIIFKVVE